MTEFYKTMDRLSGRHRAHSQHDDVGSSLSVGRAGRPDRNPPTWFLPRWLFIVFHQSDDAISCDRSFNIGGGSLMGEVIQFLPFKLHRRMAESAELDIAQIALEGGPVLEIPMSDVEAYRAAPDCRVEPPADCPA